MTNGKQIRLSPDTMKELKKMGKPFESVDDCLQRLISCDCVQGEMKKQLEKDDDEEDDNS